MVVKGGLEGGSQCGCLGIELQCSGSRGPDGSRLQAANDAACKQAPCGPSGGTWASLILRFMLDFRLTFRILFRKIHYERNMMRGHRVRLA